MVASYKLSTVTEDDEESASALVPQGFWPKERLWTGTEKASAGPGTRFRSDPSSYSELAVDDEANVTRPSATAASSAEDPFRSWLLFRKPIRMLAEAFDLPENWDENGALPPAPSA